MRWIQDCLNHAMSARLPVDGVMTPATRSLVRSFQQQRGLRVSGIVGPDTEEALRAACAGQAGRAAAEPADSGTDQEWGAETGADGRAALASGMGESELTLQQALSDPRAAGPGIYTLYKGGRRFYVGKSENLARRLRQHLWCLEHTAVDTGDYRVKLTPMKGAKPGQLGRVEAAVIAKWGRRKQGGLLTNVKTRELE